MKNQQHQTYLKQKLFYLLLLFIAISFISISCGKGIDDNNNPDNIPSCNFKDSGNWNSIITNNPSIWGIDAAEYDNNIDRLYLAGTFEGNTNYVVKYWDGASLFSMEGMRADRIYGIKVDNNGNLYAFGARLKLGNSQRAPILKWDGQSWSLVGGWYETNSSLKVIRDIDFDSNGNLYVVGNFEVNTVNGIANGCMKWDGNNWTPLFSHLYGNYITKIEIDKNDLVYVCGVFSGFDNVNLNKIAKWNGHEWSNLAYGIAGGHSERIDMKINYKNELIVAAPYILNEHLANSGTSISKWDGNQWSSVGNAITDVVSQLVLCGDKIIAGKYYSNNDQYYIVYWDGNQWFGLGTTITNKVKSLKLTKNGSLYVGGDNLYSENGKEIHLTEWR